MICLCSPLSSSFSQWLPTLPSPSHSLASLPCFSFPLASISSNLASAPTAIPTGRAGRAMLHTSPFPRTFAMFPPGLPIPVYAQCCWVMAVTKLGFGICWLHRYHWIKQLRVKIHWNTRVTDRSQAQPRAWQGTQAIPNRLLRCNWQHLAIREISCMDFATLH